VLPEGPLRRCGDTEQPPQRMMEAARGVLPSHRRKRRPMRIERALLISLTFIALFFTMVRLSFKRLAVGQGSAAGSFNGSSAVASIGRPQISRRCKCCADAAPVGGGALTSKATC
jgi:hypothetical protein